MKRTVSFILLAVFVLILVSCGSVSYRSDVSVQDIAKEAEKGMSHADNLAKASADFLSFFLNVDPSLCDGFTVKNPTGSVSIDEYGIFKAKDAQSAEKISAALSSYLQSRIDTWDTRYDQSEKSKVENAETKTFGVYVCYAILSDAERNAFFGCVEGMLK